MNLSRNRVAALIGQAALLVAFWLLAAALLFAPAWDWSGTLGLTPSSSGSASPGTTR